MKKMIIALCVSAMFGCAHLEALNQKQSLSYVSKEINEMDSEIVGEDMAKFLTNQLPAAKTTLYIEPSDSVVREVLVYELTKKGFGILEVIQNQGSAVSLQYFVTPLDKGILVRIRYQDKISSRYYGRQTNGELSPSGKVAVREAKK